MKSQMDLYWPNGSKEPNREDLTNLLADLASKSGFELASKECAEYLDGVDPLRRFREMFHLPTLGSLYKVLPEYIENMGENTPGIYLSGNSLGLQPKNTEGLIQEELLKWQRRGVQGHFDDSARPWKGIAETLQEDMATIVGGLPHEVVIMNSLTVNLHMMMASFYRPTEARHKILIERKAFPSDHYAVMSQVRYHGYDDSAMILIDNGTEEALDVIEKRGHEIALVLLPGAQYYSGLVFDIPTITAAAQKQGCVAGWDLAHAAGNVIIKLHEWNVDFAAWCSYKYLNSGPGGVSGAFVHEKHHANPELPRLLGWWSHDSDTRFQMTNEFVPQPGALAYAMSNPGAIDCVALRANLNVYKQTSMEELRAKSVVLTGYMETLLQQRIKSKSFRIITTDKLEQRGCQLSVWVGSAVKLVYEYLAQHGIVVDLREPNVLRLAPVPLYNSFADAWNFVEILNAGIEIHCQ